MYESVTHASRINTGPRTGGCRAQVYTELHQPSFLPEVQFESSN